MSSLLLPITRNVLNNVISKPWTSLFQKATYKSSISLDKLYPNSSLKLITPEFEPKVESKFDGYIPITKLDISYSRSSGPGGQSVNKINSKVDLRFKVSDAEWLDNTIREKILDTFKNQLTKEGYLVIKSELTNSQQLNLADCMRKLRDLIRKIDEPPKLPSQKSIERQRRLFEKAARERLQQKREDSVKKQLRQAPSYGDL